MYLRLAILAAIVLALAATHWKAYTVGAKNVRAQWNSAIHAANEQARETERLRQKAVDAAVAAAVVRESVLRADADRARRVVDGMRGTLDVIEQSSKESHEAATRSVAALRAVYDACVAEYRAMGEEAARHASDSLMLQQGWSK